MSAFRLLETIGLFSATRSAGRRRRSSASRSEQRLVGRYLLREPIGRGAFGEVWRADDPRIGRAVAVKLLKVPAGAAGAQKTEWEKRFVREARAAGALTHPGIVTVHDVGVTEDGRPFIVMELVDGSSLDEVLREGPVDEKTALVWGAQISDALAAAHRQGIVHRDIKPANVLIDATGRARIADFGIARLSESDLTHEGLFLGSPAFSSPEQIKGAPLDGRSDLFSLGAVIYALLAGARPFQGQDLGSLAYAIGHVEPAPLRRLAQGITAQAEAVVMKALEKEPGKRYASAEEMAADLRAVAAGRPPLRAEVPESLEETVRSDASPGARQGPPARRIVARGPTGSAAGLALAAALVMAVGAAVTAGVILSRPGGSAAASTAPSRGASPARAALGAAPPGGAATPEADAARWADEATMAEVEVAIDHPLAAGRLTIRADRRRLLQAPLTDRSGGPWTVRLPSGEISIRATVEAGEGGLVVEEVSSRTVARRERLRLHLRLKERPSPKLDMMWTPN